LESVAVDPVVGEFALDGTEPLEAKDLRLAEAGRALTLGKEYYTRCQWERSLKKGDRVAVLGRGIAVVEQVDDKKALVVLWNRRVVRIPGKDIVWNQQNRRWECEANT